MALSDLADRLREFADERDWDRFHSPKNLAISISVEAAEPLELYQWSRGLNEWDCVNEEPTRARTEEELADILLYLIRFADKAGIDLEAAALRKLERNAAKYPAAKFRGSDRRYDQ